MHTNAPQLILIAGLSSSGKSRRLNELTQLRGQCQFEHDWRGWDNAEYRSRLFAQLRQGTNCVVESAGFARPRILDGLLNELEQAVPDADYGLEYFDNNPILSMNLALKDRSKPYGGNGALARVAQISRDCRDYCPDPSRGHVHPIHPSAELAQYEPGKFPEYDRALDDIRKIQTLNGQALSSLHMQHFAAMAPDDHDRLIRQVEGVVEATIAKLHLTGRDSI